MPTAKHADAVRKACRRETLEALKEEWVQPHAKPLWKILENTVSAYVAQHADTSLDDEWIEYVLYLMMDERREVHERLTDPEV